MEQHGKTLAGSHKLGLEHAPDRLLTRLAENEGILIGACNLLTEAVTANRRIAPAGEWLLDNFYLIEEQIRTARRHLPKRLQPGTAAPGEWPVGGAAARLRHRAGDDLPRRWTGGCGKPQRFRSGLPDGVTSCNWANCGPSRSCCAWR